MLCLCTFAAAHADDFLSELIGPYPVPGSIEEQRDVEMLLHYQNTRTEAECAAAGMESDVSLKALFGGEKGPLTDAEINKAKRKFIKLTIDAGFTIVVAKEKYDRPRPYLSHPQIKPCIELESSKAYPSGHAMFGRMFARVLSNMFPEREIQLIRRGDEIGRNRMLGGVHYPSDVAAGKALGDQLADEYLNRHFDL